MNMERERAKNGANTQILNTHIYAQCAQLIYNPEVVWLSTDDTIWNEKKNRNQMKKKAAIQLFYPFCNSIIP